MSKRSDKQSAATIESVKADYPEVYQRVFGRGKAEGEKAARDRFNKINELCGDHFDLVAECFVKDLSDIETMRAVTIKLERRLAETQEASAKAASDAIDPAVAEFTNENEKNDTTPNGTAKIKRKKGAKNEQNDGR